MNLNDFFNKRYLFNKAVWKGKFKEHYQYGDKIKSLIKDISKILEDVKGET